MRNQLAVCGVFAVCAVFKHEAAPAPAHGYASGRGWAENLMTLCQAERFLDESRQSAVKIVL